MPASSTARASTLWDWLAAAKGVYVRTALHHETDLDDDVTFGPGPLHRLQAAHVVHLAFTGSVSLTVSWGVLPDSPHRFSRWSS